MESKLKLLLFIADIDNDVYSYERIIDKISPLLFEKYECEILVIDNKPVEFPKEIDSIIANKKNVKIISDPFNRQYGRSQKMAFHYAIINNFDITVHLHIDKGNTVTMIDGLIAPIIENKMDLVMASRKRKRTFTNVLFKGIGDSFLTYILNRILKCQFTDYHSRHRAYSVAALKSLPFERNSNEFHFNTQIIIQFLFSKKRIKEIFVGEKYLDKIHLKNDLKYAWNVLRMAVLCKLHKYSILYQREFDVIPYTTQYTAKLGYVSSHTMALDHIDSNTRVLDMGCNEGYLGEMIKKKGCFLVGMDAVSLLKGNSYDEFILFNLNEVHKLPVLDSYDSILLLDVIEHLDNPEIFLDKVREKSKLKCPKIIITTPNIAFLIIRLQLLFAQFNYGKQGILDLTHKRLFTFYSIKKLCLSCGYKIRKVSGIPAPFPKAFGKNSFSMSLLWINKMLIHINKSLFSYQIYIEIEPTPLIGELLNKSIKNNNG